MIRAEAIKLNGTIEIIAGLAGALAAVPVAAVAYAVPAEGAVRLPPRWWTAGSTPRLVVLAAAVITGSGSALIGATITAPVVLPAFWLVAVVGTGLAIVDIRHRRLPHILTGLLWAACASCFVADAINKHEAGALVRACVVATAVVSLLLLVAIALPGQLGLGDVNLAGVLAFSLTWVGLVSAMTGIAAGLVLQATIALLAVRLRETARREIAMGPSLLVGWLLAITVIPA